MTPSGGYHIPFITDVQGAEKLSSLRTAVESLGRVHGVSNTSLRDFVATVNEEIAGGRKLESVLKDAASAQGGFDKATQHVARALSDQVRMTRELERETERLRQAEQRAATQAERQSQRIPNLAGRLGGRL